MSAAEASRATFQVRVQPRASRNAVIREPDGRIRVALAAPPVEGAANKALTVFLAERLGVPKRAVTVVSGAKSREKTIAVAGMTDAELTKRLFPEG